MPIPTIISRVEGNNYFTYTTDVTNQLYWERGDSFPVGVVDIRDTVTFAHVVCCVADMVDGTCAVIRSLDMAKTWSVTWTHSQKIKMMRLYDNGWILLCDDTGAWYQSVQSGASFELLTSSGPIGRNMVYTNDDRIIVHDGTKLWLSINDAVDWTMIKDLLPGSPIDPIRAALATSNMYVLAGAGNKLWRSPDFGQSWEVSKIFDTGEYVQSLSPMDTTTMTPGFMVVTHRTFENVNRVYYSGDTGKNFIPKVDIDFNPNARIFSDHIKQTGLPTTETIAVISGMVTSDYGGRYPKLFKTFNGSAWSDKYIWPEG